jgi:hypothetical protein
LDRDRSEYTSTFINRKIDSLCNVFRIRVMMMYGNKTADEQPGHGLQRLERDAMRYAGKEKVS